MKYSTYNLQTSLTIALAEFLRSKGYDVFWHTAGLLEEQTAGLDEAKATITLVPDFPSDPAYIVPANPGNVQRLKSGSTSHAEIVVPALSLQVLGTPRKGRILGLGHREYEWVRDVRVDGLAADQFQHFSLADLLHDWFTKDEYRVVPVDDYEADPANPPALEPVEVLQQVSETERQELVHEVEAVRYYLRTTTRVTYVE